MASALAANASRFTFTAGSIPFRVAAFKANEQISSLFELRLKLAATDSVAATDIIGEPGLLTIESEDQDRLLHGIVHACFSTGTNGRFNLYEAVVLPQAALLAHRRDCRIFQHQSVPDIVPQVLRQAGVTSDLFSFRLQGEYARHAYCVQYRETDLDFIRRLLAQEGIFFFFEHSRDGHIMVFGDSTVNYQPIAGKETVPFNPGGGMVAETEAVLKFKRGRRILSGKYAQRDFNFEKPALDLSADDRSRAHPHLELYDYPGAYDLPEQGARLAKIRLEAAAMNHDRAMGKSAIARFTPGFTFTLADGQSDDHDGQYMLTKLEHTGQQPQVLAEKTNSASGTVYQNNFCALPASVSFRPNGDLLTKPTVRGVQTAIVTGPPGEEIYTDRHGRVKVQFHWDRQGRRDENSSCWIRVSQGWAGSGWGGMHIPRIGQEVIVDFLEGDPNRPIITGRVYHGTNPPPYDLPAHKTRSTIKSDSTPGGNGSNEIRFEDKKGDEEIYLHGQKDWNIAIENDKGQNIGHDETIAVANNRTKCVGADQQETIGANKQIQVGRNHEERIGARMDLNIGQSKTETVSLASIENIGGAKTLTVGAAYAVTVAGAMNTAVGLAHTEEVGLTKKTMVGKSFDMSAGDGIEFVCGKARLRLEKDGGVTISGTRFNFSASGTVQINGKDVEIN